MSEVLRITTLGGLSIQRDGEAVTGFASRKVEALLVYLACTGRTHPREVLAELLWEERSQERAMGNLRVALTSLRKELGDFVIITRETVTINPEAEIWLDCAELEAKLAAGEGEEAVELYQGPFLEGYYLRGARGFEDWASLERERLGRRVLEALGALANGDLQRGAFRAGVEHASRLLALDPLNEGAHRTMMLLLACSGQRGAALAQYETCRQVLMDELGVEPSPELHDTYDQLSKGERPEGIPEIPGVKERPLEALGECPYRGLAAFRESDTSFFFGREAFTERLSKAVKTQPMVAVIVGSSGSGKSSVVYAGLLPQLREEDGWLIADFRPGAEPFQALAAALLPLLEPGLSETDQLVEIEKQSKALQSGELTLISVVKRTLQKHSGEDSLLLIVDQFEELYTLCPEPETRRRYLDVLLDAVQTANGRRESPFVLLLTMRADFMGQALAHRPFADALQEASLIMGPMNRAELRTAIEKPAEIQGAAFEAGLVERLLDDVGDEPGNLPLLEFALTLLWEGQSYGWMTHEGYESIGRVDGALANYADQVYSELSGDQQEGARQVFVQLVRPGAGTEDTRRLATRDQVGQGNWRLVQRLADKRLVVTGQDAAGHETVEVVHEALIQGWSQLRTWIEADRAFRTWQERLRAALRAWERSQRDEGALLRGAPLAEAEAWLDDRGEELSQAEVDYIQAGVALREQRQMERERRRRRVVIGLGVGLVVALVLAIIAGAQWQRADDASALALARQGTAQAASTQAIDERSAALTAQAQEANQRATAQAASTLAIDERSAALTAQAQEADQRTIAEANADAHATAQADAEQQRGEAETQREVAEEQRYEARKQAGIGLAAQALREIETGRQDIGVLLALEALENYPYTWQAEQALGQTVLQSRLRLILPHESGVISAEWSPDGDRLATGSRDFTAKIWDMTSGELLHTLQLEGNVRFTRWSPDGRRIATTAGGTGAVVLWDSESGERLATLEGEPGAIRWVEWSPDGTRILSTGGEANITRIWDDETCAELLRVDTDGANTIAAWSPSGDRFVVGGQEVNKIFDATTGTELLRFSVQEPRSTSLPAWSPDGALIATTEMNQRIYLWDASTGESLGLLGEFGGFTFAPNWSPSGDRLLASSRDGKLKVWEISTKEEILTIVDPVGAINGARWSPDGGKIAFFGSSGAKIVDAETGDTLLELGGNIGLTWGVAWSPSGERLIASLSDGSLRVWDTQSGLQVLHFPLGDTGWVQWSAERDEILLTRSATVIKLPIWNSMQELIEYAYDCCVVRELTADERELYGLSVEE